MCEWLLLKKTLVCLMKQLAEEEVATHVWRWLHLLLKQMHGCLAKGLPLALLGKRPHKGFDGGSDHLQYQALHRGGQINAISILLPFGEMGTSTQRMLL